MSKFLPSEPPTEDDAQKALQIAREQGWYSDEAGFVWDRKPTRWERLADRTPTWLIVLVLFAPGWVFVLCVIFGGFR